MASVMISVEGVTVKRSSGKPKRLLNGQRRKAAHKALQALTFLENQESAEDVRSAKNNYDAFFVLGGTASKWKKALAELKARLDSCLKAKA